MRTSSLFLRPALLLSTLIFAACASGTGRPPVDGGPDSGAEPDSAVEPTCMEECADGSQSCDGTSLYRVCGQYDLDPCLELSPPIACADGYECVSTTCAPPCRDECPVDVAICMDETTLLACG